LRPKGAGARDRAAECSHSAGAREESSAGPRVIRQSVQPPVRRSDDPGTRLFRALLIVYPRDFRGRFTEEMVDFFRERRVEQYRNGPRGAIRLWLHLVADIMVTAPMLHVRAALAPSRPLALSPSSFDVP